MSHKQYLFCAIVSFCGVLSNVASEGDPEDFCMVDPTEAVQIPSEQNSSAGTDSVSVAALFAAARAEVLSQDQIPALVRQAELTEVPLTQKAALTVSVAQGGNTASGDYDETVLRQLAQKQKDSPTSQATLRKQTGNAANFFAPSQAPIRLGGPSFSDPADTVGNTSGASSPVVQNSPHSPKTGTSQKKGGCLRCLRCCCPKKASAKVKEK